MCPARGASHRNLHFVLKTLFLPALIVHLTIGFARAERATWTGESGNSWSTPENWDPAVAPSGPHAIANFADSAQTTIGLSYAYWVSSMTFEPTASGFSFAKYLGDFRFTGAGVINKSDQLQSFDIGWICYSCGGGYPASISFYNEASAGRLTQFTVEAAPGDDIFGGELSFWDSSTAGSAVINDLGGNFYYGRGVTYFQDRSSAENATITNGGSAGDYSYGQVTFYDRSTAGNATIINNGALSRNGSGGSTVFSDHSSTGTSTIICNGDSVGSDRPATVSLYNTEGQARIILLGIGRMNLTGGFDGLKATVGSIEGDGNIYLGQTKRSDLTVGTNNQSTTFSGIIQDNVFSSGGSLRKVGSGTLSLTGANSYSRGTTIEGGELQVENSAGSGTGTGAVQVMMGTLGGHGSISGVVTVGAGTDSGAFLAPGDAKVGTLTIESEVIFNAEGNYACTLDIKSGQADQVLANGVTINPGANFSISALGQGEITIGTVFTVISNTGAAPISGAFSNLGDGAIILLNGNKLQASYSGGDGNDLTLTAVL